MLLPAPLPVAGAVFGVARERAATLPAVAATGATALTLTGVAPVIPGAVPTAVAVLPAPVVSGRAPLAGTAVVPSFTAERARP
ncbi:hypothetical protein ABZT47_21455 [Sphaerisporangium sp. NPDC005289]|uniref:hypothetical protein n=1 Tax=Sphaerisporangium sp. NPDC005289 TaxID=3155247 RepID=UPI0033B09F7A